MRSRRHRAIAKAEFYLEQYENYLEEARACGFNIVKREDGKYWGIMRFD